MDNAGRVGHFERVRNLHPEVQKLFERDGLALDAVLQRRPFQALHDDEEPVLMFADVVDGADVGMIQRRCGTRFPLKSLSCLGILCQFFGKELQGHTPAKALVFRLVHDAHSAATQLSYNAVMGDCLLQHVADNVRPWAEASQFRLEGRSRVSSLPLCSRWWMGRSRNVRACLAGIVPAPRASCAPSARPCGGGNWSDWKPCRPNPPKRIRHSARSPSACQKVIWRQPKSGGSSQFHRCSTTSPPMAINSSNRQNRQRSHENPFLHLVSCSVPHAFVNSS